MRRRVRSVNSPHTKSASRWEDDEMPTAMVNELERIWKGEVITCLTSYTGVCREGLRNYVAQKNRVQGQDLNPGLLEY
jgi:hypothetical protein